MFSCLILLSSNLLAFAAAFLVLFEPAQAEGRSYPAAGRQGGGLSMLSMHNNVSRRSSNWPLTLQLDLSSDDCEVHFVGILPTLQYLVENALEGGQFFACGAASDLSAWFWVLSLLFYGTTGLLMLNM